jgi:hypothetical protein
MGKLKDMERAQDLAPKQVTHAHEVSVVGPYYAQCINGEIAACANCEDSLYGYMYGTIYCDRCADSI